MFIPLWKTERKITCLRWNLFSDDNDTKELNEKTGKTAVEVNNNDKNTNGDSNKNKKRKKKKEQLLIFLQLV